MRLGAGAAARPDNNRNFFVYTRAEHQPQIAFHGFTRIQALAGAEIESTGIGAAAVDADEVGFALQAAGQ